MNCLYIDGGRAGSVGPAALFSLQFSYVLFMPFVERPALHGHRWQCQAEDNEGRCQLTLQDLAVSTMAAVGERGDDSRSARRF